ncbi:AraC family transcriptional regulator [Aliidongia dinghuensis]|uniref:AraC family transcriptional regulator n=1 Tax=Aliidongia dinghuensis TaxID=1867774 RepID=A0A8J2YUS0_9PROT|nr:GlxA family transcriptional regulator [Aliidongia dinghuensis]GGF24905.1 AraC family transcriptional regulator [Aliidongia dinghuensis]
MDTVVTRQRLFVFYLVPDFTLLAFSSAVEALRLANYVLGYEAYAWRLVSADGGKVWASCGVSFDTDNDVAAERQMLARGQRPFMTVICAGHHVERHANKPTEAWLRECRQNGVAIASLCTGAHILARAKLLDDKKCVIHWENFPSFVEQFRGACVRTSLFAIDGGIHTCAGGTASFDMMLHIIQRDFGEVVVSGVCELAFVDRVRSPSDRQRLPFARRTGALHPEITSLIERMQETLTEPLPVDELMVGIRLTRRQIERLFRNELSCSPARYYMKLRLERAKLLLSQMTTPIVEVAIASGFSSASHFSKCYRETYGCSPQQTRKHKSLALGAA